MLCSSGSSWLDRLRIAKGFTEDGFTDLENFVQNRHSCNSEIPNRNPRPFDTSRDEDKKLVNMMSNVICELFNFGDNCSNSTGVKKSARKQANPRICSFPNNGNSASDNVDSEKAASRSGDSNSGVDGVKESNERIDEGEGDGREVNLPGFSRSEVTVIDTSCDPWKFDKLLFRKKNVWKVRDKRGRSESVGSKRRKQGKRCTEDDHSGKKHKIEDKEGCGEECELPLNGVYPQRDELEAPERCPDKVRKFLKKKQEDTLSDRLEKESSSIIIIKSIPTYKKNGIIIPKNCLKAKQNKR